MGQKIAILGSTGSIGRSTCEVLRTCTDRFTVSGVAAGNNINPLIEQIREFRPRIVAVKTKENAVRLRGLFPELNVVYGPEGLLEMVSNPRPDFVIVAINGTDALAATLKAIESGCRICLANKETLVAAGDLIQSALMDSESEILPVDSEQSAIFQCLGEQGRRYLKKVILTASGGPFFDQRIDFSKVTPEAALAHPVWSMGRKISVDSATLMNKALEVIEAHYLFSLSEEKIEVLIHPQSTIHSMVEFVDSTIIAQMSVPDMKLPILYSLTYPERIITAYPSVDFSALKRMEFYPVDHSRFPSIRMARDVLKTGMNAGAVFNTANEVAVEYFLSGRITFDKIFAIVEEILNRAVFHPVIRLADVMETIKETKGKTVELLEGIHP